MTWCLKPLRRLAESLTRKGLRLRNRSALKGTHPRRGKTFNLLFRASRFSIKLESKLTRREGKQRGDSFQSNLVVYEEALSAFLATNYKLKKVGWVELLFQLSYFRLRMNTAMAMAIIIAIADPIVYISYGGNGFSGGGGVSGGASVTYRTVWAYDG
jgi:hypothetical protein